MITNSNNKLLKRSWTRNSIASVSRELGVDEGVLHNWKKLKLESSSNLERENLELKKRLREVEMERDILKKAAIYASSAEAVREIQIH